MFGKIKRLDKRYLRRKNIVQDIKNTCTEYFFHPHYRRERTERQVTQTNIYPFPTIKAPAQPVPAAPAAARTAVATAVASAATQNASCQGLQAPDERVAQLAWAAGFCDGEGCILISKQHTKGRKSPTYRLRLDLVQNNRETLIHFQKTAAACGADSHLFTVGRSTSHNRQIYSLVFDGRHAAQCLDALLPYLVRKRPEALVALSYMRTASPGVLPGPGGHPASIWKLRESYRLKLQAMK